MQSSRISDLISGKSGKGGKLRESSPWTEVSRSGKSGYMSSERSEWTAQFGGPVGPGGFDYRRTWNYREGDPANSANSVDFDDVTGAGAFFTAMPQANNETETDDAFVTEVGLAEEAGFVSDGDVGRGLGGYMDVDSRHASDYGYHVLGPRTESPGYANLCRLNANLLASSGSSANTTSRSGSAESSLSRGFVADNGRFSGDPSIADGYFSRPGTSSESLHASSGPSARGFPAGAGNYVGSCSSQGSPARFGGSYICGSAGAGSQAGSCRSQRSCDESCAEISREHDSERSGSPRFEPAIRSSSSGGYRGGYRSPPGLQWSFSEPGNRNRNGGSCGVGERARNDGKGLYHVEDRRVRSGYFPGSQNFDRSEGFDTRSPHVDWSGARGGGQSRKGESGGREHAQTHGGYMGEYAQHGNSVSRGYRGGSADNARSGGPGRDGTYFAGRSLRFVDTW